VGAQDERLLDVGGAGRACDEVYGAGQGALAVALTYALPNGFVVAGDIGAAIATIWVSGRKFSVVGLSWPERRTSVPVSATPPRRG
jgi:hypothetical protein